MTMGEALSRAAGQANLSDVAIAAEIGVTQQTVTDWRKDRKSPRHQHFVRLLEIVPGFGKLVGVELTGQRAS